VFVAVGTFLLSLCLAMNVSSRFTILTFSRHATILFSLKFEKYLRCYVKLYFNYINIIFTYKWTYEFRKGRALAQAVSRWLPTGRGTPSGRHVGFMVDKTALGQVFSEYFCFPANHHSINFSSIIIITQGWHNRRSGGRSAGGNPITLHPPYQNEFRKLCLTLYLEYETLVIF
jgi:hypothetical protein